MANDAPFYRRQANLQRADAAAATLANVRERCERAALSWDEMAARAERASEARHKREAAADDVLINQA